MPRLGRSEGFSFSSPGWTSGPKVCLSDANNIRLGQQRGLFGKAGVGDGPWPGPHRQPAQPPPAQLAPQGLDRRREEILSPALVDPRQIAHFQHIGLVAVVDLYSCTKSLEYSIHQVLQPISELGTPGRDAILTSLINFKGVNYDDLPL
jgi:hypothetical protein